MCKGEKMNFVISLMKLSIKAILGGVALYVIILFFLVLFPAETRYEIKGLLHCLFHLGVEVLKSFLLGIIVLVTVLHLCKKSNSDT
jgi:hypothetical protein